MVDVRHSSILRTIPVLITACLLALPVQAKYSGGTGEPNDPYQIATASDLIALGNEPNDYHEHFILTADIDLDPNLPGGKVFDRAVIAPDTNDATEWFQGTHFTGVFDGKGHVIRHLTITGGGYLGLFGLLTHGAEVVDLGVLDVNVTGVGDCVGGLVGLGSGYFTVSRCCSTSAVSGADHVGGLVGLNGWGGRIVDCYSIGAVIGRGNVGGLAGSNGGLVSQSYSAGLVTGKSSVGGLVGDGAALDRMGHPVPGTVTACFWDIEASGQATSAGGTGKTTAEMQTAGTFLQAAWDFVDETANGTEDIWKIAEGLGYPRLSWEKYSGGSGTAADRYQIATFEDLIALGETPEDYDKHFILTADIDLDPNQPGGKVFDKAVIAPDTNNTNWWFYGTRFSGVFDGNGHTISHLTIAGESYLGLFGYLVPGAEVKNLGLVDVNMTGSGDYVGGLIGYDEGAVSRCYSTCMVRGGLCVGGLVGETCGTVTQCFSTGTVEGNDYVGGLIGVVSGATIRDCYSTASVAGHNSGGGFVGAGAWDEEDWPPDISRCYSAGPVTGESGAGGLVPYDDGSLNACFWDMQISGQTTNVGGYGLTTGEMQMAKTFLDAGWDFVGETANGPNDIWKIAEGVDYPRLAWEPYDGRVTVVLGQIFTVTLESNPSTGYRWEWVDSQDSIVEQIGQAQFKPRETGDPPLVGAGGWESFDFKAVNQGQMTLKLVYRRPWEEGVEPLKTFSLQVAVP